MSAVDALLDDISSRVERHTLGADPNSVHIVTVNVELTLPSPGDRPHTTTITAAGIHPDPGVAHARCLSELAERVVGVAPVVLERGSTPFPDTGTTVLPWQLFTPHAPDSLARLEVSLGRRPPRWFRGTGLVSGKRYSVPASKVFPGWHLLADAGDDGECDASGLASGPADETGRWRLHGLCEVLERDALMLAWRLPSWAVADLDHARLGDTVAGFIDSAGLRLSLYEIGDPGLAPVVLGVLSDGSAAVCGSGCAGDVGQAAEHAALEAVLLWWGARERRMRAPAPDQIRDSPDHVAWSWSNGDVVRDWFSALPRRALTDRASGLVELAARCRSTFFGFEPVAVDLAGAGTGKRYVCRILQPHAARKEWSALRPFVGGARLAAMSEGRAEPNALPHPYG